MFKYILSPTISVGKAALDRMAQDMNTELEGTGVYAMAVWPGGVKTELMDDHVIGNKELGRNLRGVQTMVENGQSIEWVGRTVAALLNDPNITKKAGKVIWCYDVSLTCSFANVLSRHVNLQRFRLLTI